MTIFYSWQSDLENKTNRGLIEDALNKAAKGIREDDSIEVEPVVDRDTKGKAGSPSIDEVIFEKIAKADAFVADISIINAAQRQLLIAGTPPVHLRPTPNPNVLLELGYAARVLTWNRVILVFNEATGDPEKDLPFDLRQKRRVTYKSQPEDEDRATPRNFLTEAFDQAIREIVKDMDSVARSEASPMQAAIEAVESQTPARKGKVRAATQWMFDELVRIQPDLTQNPNDPSVYEGQISALRVAISACSTTVEHWLSICSVVALCKDYECFPALTQFLESVQSECETKPRFSGVSYGTEHDFWRVLCHELFVALVAILIKEDRWEMIDALLTTNFQKPDNGGLGTFVSTSLHQFSLCSRLLLDASKRAEAVSVRAEMLKTRYESGIGISFPEFVDADLFMYLASRFRQRGEFDAWTPWSTGAYKGTPMFLAKATSHAAADKVKLGFGCADSNVIRAEFYSLSDRLGRMWTNLQIFNWIDRSAIERFDTL